MTAPADKPVRPPFEPATTSSPDGSYNNDRAIPVISQETPAGLNRG